MDGVPADDASGGAADVAVASAPSAATDGRASAAGPFDTGLLAAEKLAGAGLFELFERVYGTDGMTTSLRKALPKLDGEALGIAHWILLEHEQAEGVLAKVKNRSEAAEHCFAHCLLRKGEGNRAQQTFEKLLKSNAGSWHHWAGVLASHAAKLDRSDEASAKDLDKALAKPPKGFEDHPDQHYWLGRLHEFRGEYEQAVQCFAAAAERDPQHRAALGALAFQLDVRGSDDDALEVYQKLAAMPPVSLRTLVNLGTMYEDRGMWDEAEACFQSILELDPTDARALLFLRDVLHSRDMYYDEDLEKKEDKLNQILRIPITDFELSVRARNCLNRMNIQTLGDLVKKTEAELLSYKNFGETSLNEIKEVLRPYGLRLGMERDDGTIDASKLQEPDPQASQDKLDMPVSDLQLSVRSRRTVDRLGCKTIRELISRTEAELLAQPNFGHTSLNEIKHKLENLGLTLSKR